MSRSTTSILPRGFRLPLTQVELGHVLGLPPVHVNKILQEFRRRGLLRLEHRVLDVLNINGPRAIAAFNKDYLQFDGASKAIARYFYEYEKQMAKSVSHTSA